MNQKSLPVKNTDKWKELESIVNEDERAGRIGRSVAAVYRDHIKEGKRFSGGMQAIFTLLRTTEIEAAERLGKEFFNALRQHTPN